MQVYDVTAGLGKVGLQIYSLEILLFANYHLAYVIESASGDFSVLYEINSRNHIVFNHLINGGR